MAAEGVPFSWRWDCGTISTKLDVIWGMSVNIVPEVGLTMAVSIGLLSLAALAANTVIAFKVGRGHGQANSVRGCPR